MCIASVGLKEEAKRGKERECRGDYKTKQRRKKGRGGNRIPMCHLSTGYYYSKIYVYFPGTCVRGSEWVGKNECTKLSYLLYLFLLCLGLPRWKCALRAISPSPPGDQIKPICIRHTARTLQHWPAVCCDPAAGCLEVAGDGLEPSDSACTKPVITKEEVSVFFKTCVSHRAAKDKPGLLPSDTQRLQWLRQCS